MTPGAGAQKRKKEKMVVAHLYVTNAHVSILKCALGNPEAHRFYDNAFVALGRVRESDLDA